MLLKGRATEGTRNKNLTKNKTATKKKKKKTQDPAVSILVFTLLRSRAHRVDPQSWESVDIRLLVIVKAADEVGISFPTISSGSQLR